MDPDRAHQIQELVRQARERTPSERAAFLDQACDGDDALRHAVERRLDHGADATMLEEVPPAQAPSVTTLGPYELGECLGEGGMGAVYRARQTEPVERWVAVKVIRAVRPGAHALARFEVERRAMARMNHPHISTILDAGADEQGRPYVVMPLIDGRPIDGFCDHARLPVRERVRLVVQIAHALQHAHDRGILHRDLKPANVLVQDHQGAPTPTVIDFGIAKALTDEGDSRTLTTDGLIVGTPRYMSPEQLAGGDVDVRSDVYALGIILYELVAGAHPLGSAADVLDPAVRRRSHDTMPSLASVATESQAEQRSTPLRNLRRQLGGDLELICRKAVRAEAARRYASMSALAQDLEGWLDGRPISARPDSLAYRSRLWFRRHPVAATAGIATLVFAVTGAASLWLHAERLEVERDRAQLAETRAVEESETLEEVVQFMEGLFVDSDPTNNGSLDLTARELLAQGATRLRDDEALAPLVRARLLRMLARVNHGMGDLPEAHALSKESLDAVPADDSPATQAVLADALLLRGTILHDQSDYAGAEATYRRAVEIMRPLPSRADRLVEALSYLAVAIQAQGRIDDALPYLKEAITHGTTRNGTTDPDVIWARTTLGYLYWQQGRSADAVAAVSDALAAQRTDPEVWDMDVVHSLHLLGNMHAWLGDLAQAEPLLTESLERCESMFDTDHPALGRALTAVAGLRRRQGRHDDATRLLGRARPMLLATLGPDHRYTVSAELLHSELLGDEGAHASAESELRALLDRPAVAEHPKVGPKVRLRWGAELVALGNAVEGQAAVQEVWDEWASTRPVGHLERGAVAIELGAAWLALDRADKATPFLEEAIVTFAPTTTEHRRAVTLLQGDGTP